LALGIIFGVVMSQQKQQHPDSQEETEESDLRR
jgi:hypothetical protein